MIWRLFHRSFRCALLLVMACCCCDAMAQQEQELLAHIEGQGDVVVVEVPDANDTGVLLRTSWKRIEGSNNYLASVQWGGSLVNNTYRIDRPLEKALGIYLDERVHFEKKGVVSDAPLPDIIADMEGLVNALIDQVDTDRSDFRFSEETIDRLQRLTKIDWSKASFGVDGDDQEKYLAIFYYVRSQRTELERSIQDDLRNVAHLQLKRSGKRMQDEVLLASVCGTVFNDDFLCALDLTLEPSAQTIADPILSPDLVTEIINGEEEEEKRDDVRAVKLRKRDRWLKAELDWLNERIDRLDNTKEVYELKDVVGDLQAQIDDIRLEMREIDERRSEPNPIAALSDLTGKNVTINFRSGSTRIDPEYDLLLNEVFAQMARSPDSRIMITGHADAVGDPATNLRLSERRARVVRNQLLSRGINAERVLVNYFGESQSRGTGNLERRVEVEWLVP